MGPNVVQELLAAWTTEQGRGRLVRHGDSVVRLEVEGCIDQPSASCLLLGLRRAVSGTTPACFFASFDASVRYPAALRLDGTRLLVANRHAVEAFHAHSESTIVRMGLSLLSIALPNVVRTCETLEDLNACFRRRLEHAASAPALVSKVG